MLIDVHVMVAHANVQLWRIKWNEHMLKKCICVLLYKIVIMIEVVYGVQNTDSDVLNEIYPFSLFPLPAWPCWYQICISFNDSPVWILFNDSPILMISCIYNCVLWLLVYCDIYVYFHWGIFSRPSNARRSECRWQHRWFKGQHSIHWYV